MKKFTDTVITERILKAENDGDWELVYMLLELKEFRAKKRFKSIINFLEPPAKQNLQRKFKMSMEERASL